MRAEQSVAAANATRHARAGMVLLCPLVLALAATGAWAVEGERPRRVLLVHSFGSSAPPFTTHSTAFESTLKRELGTGVDLDEVSLDMARYAQPDMEEAFAEFLAKRFSRWRPDLVVPVGSPAGRFVAKHRDRLFPQMPVIYTGMDKRTLPPDAFAQNATFVGEEFDLKGLVDDMLQLDPETNHVVVILGASPLERYWTTEFRKAFAPFEGRVRFTWANDLSFDQMLDLVSKLPPHSFVLLGLLMRDAAGVTYNEDDALARLRAVSSAPINGLFEHQLGMGIVGGRLYQGELQGAEWHNGRRGCCGEPASNFPPLVIGTTEPTYDARELARWRIDEGRLPPGSVVKFRQPTAWDQYRWHAAGAGAVIAVQALFIVALLVQRRRRRVAERANDIAQAEVRQKRAELAHVARVATLGELTTTLTHELRQPLASILLDTYRAELLLNGGGPDVPTARGVLAEIRAGAERAGDVIGHLRDMLKAGPARGFVTIDLNDVVRAVEHIARGDANLHKIAVDLDLSPGKLLVSGDDVQLQQVLLNLLLNAFGAMNEADPGDARRVSVRTRSVDGRTARMEVRDGGTGIAPEEIETIFAPFVTTKPDGLGMGLSICRTIVDGHGGKIWATNNPDRGATFLVTLPTARNAEIDVKHRPPAMV